jgi:hypothetical protein
MGPPDDERKEPDEPAGADEPTRELPGVPDGGSGDRCAACGAPLGHDQRYCVECGERRGQSRFPVSQPAAEVVSTRRTRWAPGPRPPRVSSGTTLVAGVGVLLLAIGLGVLIGRIGTKATTTQAADVRPQVITVQGGGGGPVTSATTAAPKLTKKAKSKLKAAAASTAKPSAAVQNKATQAAGKVLGNSKNLAPPTVTTGQKCTGAGCQGGKFTGNFFGP